MPGDEITLEPTDQDAFKVWTAGQPSGHPNFLGRVGATIYLGPQVCKTVMISRYGNGQTQEVSTTELRFSTYDRVAGGFDFSKPRESWHVRNDQVERLLAFLNEDSIGSGRFRVVDASSPVGEILQILEGRDADVHEVVKGLVVHTDPFAISEALASSAAGLEAAEGTVIIQRRDLVERAAAAAADPSSTETVMQGLIDKAWWLFGGRYVGVLQRRDLLPLDEHDIPLITADGALHIVELKGPAIPGLVKKYRNHWIVGKDVHEASMQAANYIRSADENALALRTQAREELGIDIDIRRIFASVIIGHRDHITAQDMPPEQLDLAFRSYNAQINRIEVLRYDQLLDAARTSLQFVGV